LHDLVNEEFAIVRGEEGSALKKLTIERDMRFTIRRNCRIIKREYESATGFEKIGLTCDVGEWKSGHSMKRAGIKASFICPCTVEAFG
jgi:hypothetical protein